MVDTTGQKNYYEVGFNLGFEGYDPDEFKKLYDQLKEDFEEQVNRLKDTMDRQVAECKHLIHVNTKQLEKLENPKNNPPQTQQKQSKRDKVSLWVVFFSLTAVLVAAMFTNRAPDIFLYVLLMGVVGLAAGILFSYLKPKARETLDQQIREKEEAIRELEARLNAIYKNTWESVEQKEANKTEALEEFLTGYIRGFGLKYSGKP
jgi:DNA repair exonuclease SbcCD ATPase subunit